MTSFHFICFGKRIHITYKKDNKFLEKKTLKTWKNHGKIMEFCWSAAVGTLTHTHTSEVSGGMNQLQTVSSASPTQHEDVIFVFCTLFGACSKISR